MPSRQQVLLVIKQNNGLHYSDLLNKLAEGYANINSARAAFSRTLKYILALGFVRKDKSNRIFLTEKGLVRLNQEMRTKLLLGLGKNLKELRALDASGAGQEALASKMPETIRQLATLVERARQDPGLLETARRSDTIFVSDLDVSLAQVRELQKKLQGSLETAQYWEKVLGQQRKALGSLDFKERIERKWDAEALDLVKALHQVSHRKAFRLETPQPWGEELLKSCQGKKVKSQFQFTGRHFACWAKKITSHPDPEFSLFFSDITCQVRKQQAEILAPAEKLPETGEGSRVQGQALQEGFQGSRPPSQHPSPPSGPSKF